MSEFLAMGGYAAFVWPSYAIGVGGLVVLALVSLRQWRAAKAELARLEAAGLSRRGRREDRG
ncbi:MAG: heme exporter protein CcmD [Acetobacteraceae bacterium]|nr:heme exporter protein CcmD [Acetobacteraceae bacterium]